MNPVSNVNSRGRLSAAAAHYAAAASTRIACAFFADLGGRGVVDVVLQVQQTPLYNTFLQH